MTWDEFRAEAAPVIREQWHQGEPRPPRRNGTEWTVGGDLSICKNLHNQGEDYETILAALEEYDGKPMDLRIWWAKGWRNNYHELRGKAMKKQSTEVPHIKQILREMSQ